MLNLQISNLCCKNYRSVTDADSGLDMRHSIIKWNHPCKDIENKVAIFKELTDVRDSYKKCTGFSPQKIDVIMLDLCTS